MLTSKRKRALPALFLAAGLSACAGAPGGSGGLGSPGVGTAAGALGGAALGRAIAGNNNNLVAILSGAALGGLAGNILGDRPSELARQQQAELARDAEQQRRLAYELQSALQQKEVRKQIEDQRLFEEWKRQRAAGTL
jgi:hypothetical protein